MLFADLKGSMELLADREPEEARQLLDPVLEGMMDAVHRYEGTVNQVLGDGVLHGLPNQYLGFAYQAQGDYRRAIDCFRQTVASLDGARRRERFGRAILPAVSSRADLAWCHAELGTFAEGRALGDEGLRIAEAVAHPESPMMASWGLGLLSLRQGDPRRALPRLERAMSVCQEPDLPGFFPRMAAALGAVYTLGGRVADAVPLLTQVMEQTTATEMGGFQALCVSP